MLNIHFERKSLTDALICHIFNILLDIFKARATHFFCKTAKSTRSLNTVRLLHAELQHSAPSKHVPTLNGSQIHTFKGITPQKLGTLF